jgi:hypothetical protein
MKLLERFKDSSATNFQNNDGIHGVFLELGLHPQWTEVICGINVTKTTVFLGITGQ